MIAFSGRIDDFFDKIKMSKSYLTLNRLSCSVKWLSVAYEIRQFHIIICTLKIQAINSDE